MKLRPLIALLLVLVLAAAVVPAGARADGDPASDVLVAENVFLPFTPPVSPPIAHALAATVARAQAAGYPIKLAVIASPTDLGAITELFGAPGRYAEFLDTEITYNSAPPLLIVMPQGFGTAGTLPASALARITIDRSGGPDGLARAAIAAVVTLAGRAGHPITPPALPTAPSAGTGTPVALVGLGAAALAAAVCAAMVAVLRRRRTLVVPRAG